MWKRRLTRIVAVLLLGSVVNVAVAWGFAMLKRERDYFGWIRGKETCFWFTQGHIETSVLDVPGETWLHQERKHWHGTGISERWWEGVNAETERNRHIPRWSWFRHCDPITQLRERGDPRDLDYTERATGWPMLALRYTRIEEYRSRPRFMTVPVRSIGLLTAPWNSSTVRSDIPCLPIPAGFALNTVIYAFVSWLLFTAPFALRRRRRIRRGLCVKCGYDLRGRGSDSNACPECGAAAHHLRPARDSSARK